MWYKLGARVGEYLKSFICIDETDTPIDVKDFDMLETNLPLKQMFGEKANKIQAQAQRKSGWRFLPGVILKMIEHEINQLPPVQGEAGQEVGTQAKRKKNEERGTPRAGSSKSGGICVIYPTLCGTLQRKPAGLAGCRVSVATRLHADADVGWRSRHESASWCYKCWQDGTMREWPAVDPLA